MAEEAHQVSALNSPQDVLKEIAKITETVQKNPKPTLKVQPTTLERVEAHGFDPAVAIVAWVGGTGLSMLTGAMLEGNKLVGSYVGLWIMLGGCAFMTAVMLPLLAYITSPKGVRLWTRVIRKKHYLALHEKEKPQQEIAKQAYEQTLAKREKVMKRMRKRAKPVIEAYNAKNPLKELAFDEVEGFVECDLYTPGQEKALRIAGSIFDENPEALVSTPALKKLR